MKHITKSVAALGALALLAACAAEPEPQVIYAQPTYDKYGNPECSTPGNEGANGTSSQLPPCLPDDGCQEGYVAGATAVPCYPQTGREPQGGTVGQPQGPNNVNPAGGPRVP